MSPSDRTKLYSVVFYVSVVVIGWMVYHFSQPTPTWKYGKPWESSPRFATGKTLDELVRELGEDANETEDKLFFKNQ